MTFYFPAIITKREQGFRVDFVDLEGCYGTGNDLESALEDARYQGVNWMLTEMEEHSDLPMQTHLDDIQIQENQTKTMIALRMPREGWDE